MFGDSLKRYQRSFDEGEVIFKEGDWGKTVFFIKEGTVDVIKQSGRHDRRIGMIEEGEMVGEMILTEDGSERSATVRARTDVTGWKFSQDQFNNLLDQNEQFRKKVITTLSTRLDKTTHELSESKSLETLLIDLSFLLFAIIDKKQWDESGPQLDLEIDLSPEFLAYHFDTSLELMNKFLSLKKQGHLFSYNQDTTEKMFKIAERIIREGLQKVNQIVTSEEGDNEKLIEWTRELRDDLETLREEERSINKQRFKKIINNFKQIKEKKDDYLKENDPGDLKQTFKDQFNTIKSEINRLYDTIL